MKKKLIKELVEKSFSGGEMRKDVVLAVADKMNRKELKEYLKLLKDQENKKYVTVTSSSPLSAKTKKELSHLFPDKKLVYDTDKALIAGIKVETSDTEFEISMNNIINELGVFLNK